MKGYSLHDRTQTLVGHEPTGISEAVFTVLKVAG